MHTTAPTALPLHPRIRHPHTGTPLQAIGFTRAGRPIWPVMGGSQPVGEPAPLTQPATPPAPVPGPGGAAPSDPPNPAAATAPTATAAAGDRGYPDGVPLEQMTGEQREAYWRHYARRNEDRLKTMGDYDALKAKAAAHDELVAATQTDHERAVAAARDAGRAEAMQQAGAVLVDAHLRAAVGTRLQPDQVSALITGINTGQFLSPDGVGVDTDKVNQFVNAVLPPTPAPASTPPGTPAVPGTPAAAVLPHTVPGAPGVPPAAVGLPRQLPDYGQGATTGTPVSDLAAGRALAQSRFAHRQPPQPHAQS